MFGGGERQFYGIQMPDQAIRFAWLARSSSASSSPQRNVPAASGVSPAKARSNDDLPAPLAPRRIRFRRAKCKAHGGKDQPVLP